ncbi:PIN domain nuclease [Streptomyces bobili]|uniref:PIN domain nuclease n=1 Tax=Streptomyces bobili TaxID=67280 RepID=UPI003667D45B
MAVERFLVDKSAWERFRHPSVKARLLPLIDRGLIATCAVVDLEILYSTRNAEDHARIRMVREGFDWLPFDDGIGTRAVEVQGLLAAKGQHRRASVADLLIAATAERHGVTVLHYDADFDGIAAVTGQPAEWVVERGAAP